MESIIFGYIFRYIELEDVTIKIDYRVFSRKSDFINYCILFEDSGWEYIVGNCWLGMYYFKKVNEESEDDIFLDLMLWVGKYKCLFKIFLELVICYLLILFLFMYSNIMNLGVFVNLKELYLMLGLWDK